MADGTWELIEESHRHAHSGNWDDAKRVALTIEDENERGEALAWLAHSLIRRGQIEQGISVLSLIRNDKAHMGAMCEKVSAQSLVPRQLLESGEPDRVGQAITDTLELLPMLDSEGVIPYIPADIFHELGAVALEFGERPWALSLWDSAVEHLRGSLSDIDCQRSLASIVIAFHCAGERARAAELIRLIEVDFIREKISKAVAAHERED